MIYLASAYSHPDPAVREYRFEAACRAAAGLLRAGVVVFAPVVSSHPLTRYDLPGDWDFWEPVDREFLRRCDRLVVLTLDGWQQSRGVQAEIAIAREMGKPIFYLSPEEAHVALTLGRVASGGKT